MSSRRAACALNAAYVALLAGVLAGPIAAADDAVTDAMAVETQLIAEVREVVDATRGRETYRYLPATTLAQGQVIYYTVRIRNPSPLFASNVAVTQRVPANTTYVAGSAAGPGAEISFSIDGGQTFAPAAELTTSVDGESRPAAPELYTHIRWRLRNPLAPGATALARFRAVFN